MPRLLSTFDDPQQSMSTLVFQIHLKQWDKSLRSPQDIALRDAYIPNQSIQSKAQFVLFESPTILDQFTTNYLNGAHTINGLDSGREIKKVMFKNGAVKLDRFILIKEGDLIKMSYQEKNEPPQSIGDLSNGWIQAKYEWRYPVEDGDKFYWMYEEVILNVAFMEELNSEVFATIEPSLVFKA